jgi:hypothetical protein
MGPGNWAGWDTKGSYVYKESKNGIIKINDENFRIILTGKCGTCAESIFNYCGSRGDNNMPIFNYKELYDFEEYFDTQAYSVKAPCWNVEDPSFYNRLENKEFKAFLPFFIDRKRITKNKELKDQNLGLVISFTSIKPNISILYFEILDLKSLDQIKKISEYKIVNEN